MARFPLEFQPSWELVLKATTRDRGRVRLNIQRFQSRTRITVYHEYNTCEILVVTFHLHTIIDPAALFAITNQCVGHWSDV